MVLHSLVLVMLRHPLSMQCAAAYHLSVLRLCCCSSGVQHVAFLPLDRRGLLQLELQRRLLASLSLFGPWQRFWRGLPLPHLHLSVMALAQTCRACWALFVQHCCAPLQLHCPGCKHSHGGSSMTPVRARCPDLHEAKAIMLACSTVQHAASGTGKTSSTPLLHMSI